MKDTSPENKTSITKEFYNWTVKYPMALLIAIGAVFVVSILLAMGWGDRFNIGGFIGKLFGQKNPDRQTKANSIPIERTEPIGTPDEHGMVQSPVEILEPSKNPFRDKGVLEIKDGKGNKTKVQLPTGVEDTEVDIVVEISPKVYGVVVKERPSGRVTSEDLFYLE